MRIPLIYLTTFFVIAVLFSSLLIGGSSPERIIVGVWEEVAWEYEKVDKSSDIDSSENKLISSEVKEAIAQEIVVHQSEVWEFLPNGKLKLHAQGKEDLELDWKIKGRGHILKLIHENQILEHYNLVELNDDEMILYFNVDMQARGIVKLTFKKQNSRYAKKI
jgi:hypothetical protein